MIRKDDGIIALADLSYLNDKHPAYEENKHLAFLDVLVHKDYRRQGLARALLHHVVGELQHLDRKTVVVDTSHEIGKLVGKHFGGKVALEGAENRLYLEDVDWEMIQAWRDEGPKRAPGVTLQEFTSVPDDIAEEYLHVYTETMMQQPLGELDIEIKETPESRKIQEQRVADLDLTWSTLISREADGAISGLTEMLYNPHTPHKVIQNLTGVKQEYRGKGLGKWLKAELLYRFHERYPELVYITTGNADSNAPMLSINRRMGFKTFKEDITFNFDTQHLLDLFC